MCSVKYQHPTCNRTSRIAAGNDATHSPAHLGNSLEPRARHLQQSIGNQGVLRMLRQPVISGAVQAAETGSPQGQPAKGAVPTTGQPMPYTAMFSIAQHGPKAHQVCSLPDTPNCVVSWAKWRLVDAAGAPVMGKVAVEEKFTLISGPAEVFKKLKEQENKSITSESGAFDDCYGLCVPEGTQDFTLKVQQNYLVNGQIAAQNILTYSSGGVLLQVCQREANGDFGTHCRRF